MKNYNILLSITKNAFFHRLVNAFFLLGLATVLFSALFYGVDALSMLRFSYTLLFWVWGPGLLIARGCGIRPRDDGFWTLGFAFGVIFFSGAFAASLYFSFSLADTFLGPLSTVCFFAIFFKKDSTNDAGKTFRSTRFFWLCGILLVGAVWCMLFLRFPTPSIVNGAVAYNNDFLWTVSNIEAFQRSFPPIDARIQGKIFYYHYFSMLYRAALCSIGSLDSFIVSSFFYPISNVFFLLFSLRFLYISFARKKRHIASRLFVLVTLFTSCASSLFNLKLSYGFFYNVFFSNILMPTHGFELSLPLFAITLGILANIPVWYGKLKRFLFPALFILSFAATVSKGPAGLLLAISACAPLPLALFFKKSRTEYPRLRTYFFVFFATAGGFLTSYFLFLGQSGGASSLTLSPGWLAWKTFGLGRDYSLLFAIFIPLHIAGFIPFGALGSASWLLKAGKKMIEIPGITILSSALAGVGGAYFLHHVGSSNLYFMMFAVPCFNVLATEWALGGWSKMKRVPRVLTICLVLLGCSSFFFSGVFYGGRGFLTAYRVFRGVPIMRTASPYSMSQDEYETLHWISRNTPPDSVLASEKFWTSDDKENEVSSARFFYYSVFSKRQMYLEGWAYSSWAYPDRPNATEERNELQRRLILLGDLFSNGQRAEQLMRQEGIDYILVDKKKRSSFSSSTLKLLFENEQVALFSLP